MTVLNAITTYSVHLKMVNMVNSVPWLFFFFLNHSYKRTRTTKKCSGRFWCSQYQKLALSFQDYLSVSKIISYPRWVTTKSARFGDWSLISADCSWALGCPWSCREMGCCCSTLLSPPWPDVPPEILGAEYSPRPLLMPPLPASLILFQPHYFFYIN